MRYVCKIVDSLCQVDGSTAALKDVINDLIKFFFGYIESGHGETVLNSCFGTVMNLIKCSNNAALAREYIQYILDRISKLDNFPQEKRELYYAGFFTIINPSLLTIRRTGGSIVLE